MPEPSRLLLAPHTDSQRQRLIYLFEEEGRGFFIWYEISGKVAKIEESSLGHIIKTLKTGSRRPLKLSLLRTVDSPSDEPTSNVPYPPDPDYITPSYFTELLDKVRQGSVILYGPEGIGKSQLAIQLAKELRDKDPTTWVFWVCATTTKKFRSDLAAIADILPVELTQDFSSDATDEVLHWLLHVRQEPCLMVVDDASVQVKILPTLLELSLSRSNFSIVTTTTDASFLKMISPEPRNWSMQGMPPMLEIVPMNRDEALQLLHKKLKIPALEAPGLSTHSQFTPLDIQLLATCHNLRLSPFLSIWKQPLPAVFELLYDNHIEKSPAAKALLYFVSYFNPPEVRALWLEYYSESREEVDELKPSLETLTKCSLMAKISGENEYRMHTAVQNLVVDKLSVDGTLDDWWRKIESFLDLHRFIPKQPSSGYARHLKYEAESPSEDDE